LLSTGVVEIVSFSSFVPNSLSGDFSAEIRLGYLYEKKAGKLVKVPVRGAMFSGNVFKMLDAMRLSREQMTMERYKGPALVRFDAECHLAGF
jgi:predicted Zn-dependent protease